MGTPGAAIDGNDQLILKGRFQQKHIENVLRRYIKGGYSDLSSDCSHRFGLRTKAHKGYIVWSKFEIAMVNDKSRSRFRSL